jgi:pimeloyl-ACP methyl ester carboxylesterase
MDALRLERASLGGISLGGSAALGFTFHSPQRVERLVLVDLYGVGNEVP